MLPPVPEQGRIHGVGDISVQVSHDLHVEHANSSGEFKRVLCCIRVLGLSLFLLSVFSQARFSSIYYVCVEVTDTDAKLIVGTACGDMVPPAGVTLVVAVQGTTGHAKHETSVGRCSWIPCFCGHKSVTTAAQVALHALQWQCC